VDISGARRVLLFCCSQEIQHFFKLDFTLNYQGMREGEEK